jgi:chromosome segregation ATPase
MSEKEVSEIEKKSRVVQFSLKVTQESKDLFKDLKDDGAYPTDGMLFDALLERYNNPLRVSRDYETKISEQQHTIEELQAKIKEKEADNGAACDTINEEREKLAKLQAAFDDLKREYNAKCAEVETLIGRVKDLEGKNRRYDGTIAVPVTELEMRCLQWLSDRENARRKSDDVTPEVFFAYAVSEMLIRGNKFAIESVPNRVIAQFEKEINGK